MNNSVVSNGKDGPLVSIIVPAYNAEETLGRCVQSALSQTYGAVEVIIVNDGSFDETPSVADALAASDSRVAVVHQENAGLSGARNTGLGVAKGELVFFLDSDDYIEPNEIETLVAEMVRSGADMVVGGFTYTLPEGSSCGVVKAKCCVVDEEGFWRHAYITSPGDHVECVVSWGKLFKKTTFHRERFDEGKLHEDEFIIHRLVSGCSRIAFADVAGYRYVQNEGSITHAIGIKSRLDASEAFLLRTKYFVDKGWNDLAWASLSSSRGTLLQSMEFEANKDDEKRRADLLHLWRANLSKLQRLDGGSIRHRITSSAFGVAPRLYFKIYQRRVKR